MKVLIAIPHYYRPTSFAPDGRPHGSVRRDPAPRIAALEATLNSLQINLSARSCVLDHASRLARHIDSAQSISIDIVLCTAGSDHLLDALTAHSQNWKHHPTKADPPFLGYECHAVLHDHLGSYDFYCYLEDDVIVSDPWFFRKLAWFNRLFGDSRVLQPNRFETGSHPHVDKFYVDGHLPVHCIPSHSQQLNAPILSAEVLGRPVTFHTGTNPHAGCFFLSQAQMAHWSKQPDFLQRSAAFIGALESAATLGLLTTFAVYKPALENADFLEVRHFGNAYLSMLVGKPG